MQTDTKSKIMENEAIKIVKRVVIFIRSSQNYGSPFVPDENNIFNERSLTARWFTTIGYFCRIFFKILKNQPLLCVASNFWYAHDNLPTCFRIRIKVWKEWIFVYEIQNDGLCLEHRNVLWWLTYIRQDGKCVYGWICVKTNWKA